MPVFPILRDFMPVRPEERPREERPRKESLTNRSTRSVEVVHDSGEDELLFDNVADPDTPLSANGLANVPGSRQHSYAPDAVKVSFIIVTVAIYNNVCKGTESTSDTPDRTQACGAYHFHRQGSSPFYPQSRFTPTEYLSLRQSFQEDVRLGICSPVEAKLKLDALDRQSTRLESYVSLPTHTDMHAVNHCSAYEIRQ